MSDYRIMQDHGEGTLSITTLETLHEGFKRGNSLLVDSLSLVRRTYSMKEYSVNFHSHTSGHSLL